MKENGDDFILTNCKNRLFLLLLSVEILGIRRSERFIGYNGERRFQGPEKRLFRESLDIAEQS